MIKIFIAGEEVVCNSNITINEEMLATSSVILNNVYPKSWEQDKDYVSRFYFPKDYSSCQIYNDDTLLFAGVVKNSGNIALNPFKPHYSTLQILDYKTLLSEGTTLDYVINNKTIPEAITELISKVSDYGFVVGNIDIDDEETIIGSYSTLNKTAYDVMQYLSEIANARWFTRMIDEDTVAIDMYSPENLVAATDIEYNQTYFENNSIVDMNYSYNAKDYRNKQVMLSKQVFASITSTDIVYSDGLNATLDLPQIVGSISNMTINGVPCSFASSTEKELGVIADVYYTVGSSTLETNEVQPSGTAIQVQYTALVQGREIVTNNGEISRIRNQINRNGTISRYEERNDVVSSDELYKVGQSYIKYKGESEIILTIKTKDNDILNIGEQVYFRINELPELNKRYMVKKKVTQRLIAEAQEIIFFTYELSSSYNDESAINYFDNQRRKASGNLGAGEFITRNVDIENTANIIFDNLVITQLSGNNGLNMVLDSPLVE